MEASTAREPRFTSAPRQTQANAGDHSAIVHAGGWVGLATAAAAWYASFAAVTNSTFGRTVLPVRPLRPTDA